MRRHLAFFAALIFLGTALGMLFYQKNHPVSFNNWHEAPTHLTQTSPENPLSFSPMLTWDKDVNAVAYEIEFFSSPPQNLSPLHTSAAAIFHTTQIYGSHYNPPLEEFAAQWLGKAPLYWRVRGLNLDHTPCTPFSELAILYTQSGLEKITAPIPINEEDRGPGTTLIYPVYHWLRPCHAAQFEVQVFAEDPVSHPEAQPLISLIGSNSNIYDTAPRFGDHPFYWRVRSLDAQGLPVSPWSKANRFYTSPQDHWQIAVFGDSISHGGGHLSYGPADFEFSWLSYLKFSAINLSRSGDTSETMVKRFEADVLPFHPKYLLILGGSNSLRGGISAASVIKDLEAIKKKCLTHGIKPIFLTLPPINPKNIRQAFDESTTPDWQMQFALVNAYICSQIHIDIAAAFDTPDGLLPTAYGMDGLHPDPRGKRLMGETVNAAWDRVKQEADKEE